MVIFSAAIPTAGMSLPESFTGARVSLAIGASVAGISMLLGMLIGLLASYYRALDNVLMRICDGLSAIPSTLLAIALMAMLGTGITNLVISLTVVSTPRLARIARSAALVVREQTYIEAMRATGASSMRIIWRHIAPNILSPVVVQASYIFANAIITEAALSFLGVGVPIPDPSWGNILNEGKAVIYKAWWMIVFPGIFTAFDGFRLKRIRRRPAGRAGSPYKLRRSVMKEKILEVKNLTTSFKTERGLMKAVDGVSFYVNKGEILGVSGGIRLRQVRNLPVHPAPL